MPVTSGCQSVSVPVHLCSALLRHLCSVATVPQLSHDTHSVNMDTRVSGAGVTSYSDYMRCLAAKYNNNQNAATPTSVPSPTLKHDLIPLLAAHQSAFPGLSFPGLSLFHPFLSPHSELKPNLSQSQTNEEQKGSLKRPKEDPLDLTDKKMKREPSSDDTDQRDSQSEPSKENMTTKTKSVTDWTVKDVEEFVSTVEDCSQYSKVE